MSGMEYVRTNSLQLAQQCLVWKPDGMREEFVMCPWPTKTLLKARLSGFFAPTFGSEATGFRVWFKYVFVPEGQEKKNGFQHWKLCAEDCARTLMPTDPRVYNE